MIYLFSGTDTFESFKRAAAKAREFATPTNGSVSIINADEVQDVNSILQKLEGVDMFSESSTLLLKRLLNNKKLTEYFAEKFNELDKYNIILWHDSKADSRLKLVKLITEKKHHVNLENPSEGEMKEWIKTYAKSLGVELNPTSVNFFYERFLFDKFGIEKELTKLSIYLSSTNKKLSEDILEKILGLDIKGDMWKFLDSFANRNKVKSLVEFDKLTKYEDNAQVIISMLNRELRLISHYKFVKESGRDISELTLAPFIIKKTAEKSKNFTTAEVKNLIKRLFDLDFAIKSGILDDKVALTIYLSTI